MNILCRYIGHSWGDGEHKQHCIRPHCHAYRMRVIAKPQWKVFDRREVEQWEKQLKKKHGRT